MKRRGVAQQRTSSMMSLKNWRNGMLENKCCPHLLFKVNYQLLLTKNDCMFSLPSNICTCILISFVNAWFIWSMTVRLSFYYSFIAFTLFATNLICCIYLSISVFAFELIFTLLVFFFGIFTVLHSLLNFYICFLNFWVFPVLASFCKFLFLGSQESCMPT